MHIGVKCTWERHTVGVRNKRMHIGKTSLAPRNPASLVSVRKANKAVFLTAAPNAVLLSFIACATFHPGLGVTS